jgi:ribosomal protein RSM22 (predicted rRNA methylase)
MSYPTYLETWWTQRAMRHFNLRDPKTAVQRLEPAVRHLSDLFTKERRADFGAYATTKELLLAYGIYVFPQTYRRNQLVIEEMLKLRVFDQWDQAETLHLLDLGAGTGAGSVAWLDALHHRPLELEAIDQSEDAIRLSEYLLKENGLQWPHLRWSAKQQEVLSFTPRRGHRYHLILASFSLNEIFHEKSAAEIAAWLATITPSLHDNGLLVILEPALRQTSTRLMELRDLLPGMGWQLLGPCPHALACPMRRENRFWCHEVRTWQPPPSLQRLNELLKYTIHELKFSFLVARRGPPSPAAPHARLVAPLSKVKGRYLTRVCDSSGQLLELDLMTRHVEVTGRRHLDQFERGDRVLLKEKSPLGGENSFRLPTPEALQPLP